MSWTVVSIRRLQQADIDAKNGNMLGFKRFDIRTGSETRMVTAFQESIANDAEILAAELLDDNRTVRARFDRLLDIPIDPKLHVTVLLDAVVFPDARHNVASYWDSVPGTKPVVPLDGGDMILNASPHPPVPPADVERK